MPIAAALATTDRRPHASQGALAVCGPLCTAVCAVLCGLVLAGCGSAPSVNRSPGERGVKQLPDRDGPGTNPPADLANLPDALPRIEPIRSGGPNKPYEVLGESYSPDVGDAPRTEKGLASWYGNKFHGRRTASGEVYNMYAMTAAHKTMTIPSYARVRNPANGREVIVRINDRGPFVRGRIIDLSYAAAVKLGVQGGVSPIEVERITYEQIRTGSWMRPGDEEAAVALAAAAITAPAPAPEPAPAPASAPAPAPLTTMPSPAALPAMDVAVTDTPTTPIASAPIATAHTAAAKGFWVQLGAFARRDGAVHFQLKVTQTLDWLAPLLAIFDERPVHRLQAGPYSSRDQARDAAERIRSALSLVPVIVERR